MITKKTAGVIMAKDLSPFTGITRKRWSGVALVWLIIFLLFVLLYISARRSVMNEIRHQAMGVAIAAAAAINSDDIVQIQTAADTNKEAYARIQQYLGRVQSSNPDIRYVYTMRRSPKDNTRESDYEYVVDMAARDVNGDGMIDGAEICELPGKAYSASNLPELVKAWYYPSADPDISPDPPYPDLISGYAPIKNSHGQTLAIVGVDVTAATVRTKLVALRGVILLVWLALSLLTMAVVKLYYQQMEVLEHNQELSAELAERNSMLLAANDQLSRNNEKFRRELRLAQSVQMGFMPKSFPRPDKITFDKYYLACDMLGGDLFDVFNIDEDHVAIYMADIAGHGVSAALISGLLKMAVSSVREHETHTAAGLTATIFQPELVLVALNEMIARELPEYEFITLLYAVLDIPRYTLTVASAGHLSPIHYDAVDRKAAKWNVPTGPALGLMPQAAYPVTEKRVAPGDKVIFYTDGLTEAMNPQNEEFGDAPMMELVEAAGTQSPAQIVAAVKHAIDKHRGGREANDDFALLVAEIR